MQNARCRYVAMVTETLSRIASKYSSAVLFLCRVEKSIDIFINVVLSLKCPKIG